MPAAMAVCTSVLFLVVNWLVPFVGIDHLLDPGSRCLQTMGLEALFKGFISNDRVRCLNQHTLHLLNRQSWDREGQQLRVSNPIAQCANPIGTDANVSYMLHVRWVPNLHFHLVILPLQSKQLSKVLDQSLQSCRYVVPHRRRKPRSGVFCCLPLSSREQMPSTALGVCCLAMSSSLPVNSPYGCDELATAHKLPIANEHSAACKLVAVCEHAVYP